MDDVELTCEAKLNQWMITIDIVVVQLTQLPATNTSEEACYVLQSCQLKLPESLLLVNYALLPLLELFHILESAHLNRSCQS